MYYAQIFRYILTLTPEEYQPRFVVPYADAISRADGLISKTWMADFEKQEFASFYLWRDKDSMDRFMQSETVVKVANEPFLKELFVTALPVDMTASQITHGIS